jgi:hypothetical protein
MESLAYKVNMMADVHIDWMIIAKMADFWVLQVNSGEPKPDMRCQCEQTGGVFKVQIAGSVDSKALVAGRRIVRLYPVSGAPTIEKGWRMISLGAPDR